MSDTRWARLPLPADEAALEGKRRRLTIGPDGEPELLEVEAPRLPEAPGWYRFPKKFGAVFLRDDGTWLDIDGNRVDAATIPDGLIRLVEAEDAS